MLRFEVNMPSLLTWEYILYTYTELYVLCCIYSSVYTAQYIQLSTPACISLQPSTFKFVFVFRPLILQQGLRSWVLCVHWWTQLAKARASWHDHYCHHIMEYKPWWINNICKHVFQAKNASAVWGQRTFAIVLTWSATCCTYRVSRSVPKRFTAEGTYYCNLGTKCQDVICIYTSQKTSIWNCNFILHLASCIFQVR